MIKVEHTVTIRRPVNDVFAFITNILNFPRWMGEVIKKSWALDEGAMGVGFRFGQTAQFLGRQVETQFIVTEYTPDVRFCVQSTTGPIPFEGCFDFEAVPEGTRFTNRSRVTAEGLVRLAQPVLAATIERQVQIDTIYLRILLER